jgi:hypothetical protein
MARIERAAEEMDEMYAGMEEQIRKHFPAMLSTSGPVADEDPAAETRVMAEMEMLFRMVERNRSKAAELKRFLDRNGIFKKFEDRFFDLFGEPGGL